MKFSPARLFDPQLRTMPMQRAEALTVALGGRVRRNGSAEIVFEHPAMRRRCVVKATRRQTTGTLMAWLRRLQTMRLALRAAFEVPDV